MRGVLRLPPTTNTNLETWFWLHFSKPSSVSSIFHNGLSYQNTTRIRTINYKRQKTMMDTIHSLHCIRTGRNDVPWRSVRGTTYSYWSAHERAGNAEDARSAKRESSGRMFRYSVFSARRMIKKENVIERDVDLRCPFAIFAHCKFINQANLLQWVSKLHVL